MASSVKMNVVNVPYTREEKFGNRSISLIPNHPLDVEMKKSVAAYHSFSSSLYRFLSSSEGLFRVGQLMEKLPKWVNGVRQEWGMQKSPVLEELSGKALTAWVWGTTFPRIFCSASEALDSIRDARSGTKGLTPKQISHRTEKAILNTTDATSMMCHGIAMTAGLFPNTAAISGTFRSVADTVGLGNDVTSLHINTQNFQRAFTAMQQADVLQVSPEMRSTITSTVWNHFLAVIKDVCSVASGVFGLILLSTGTAVVSGLALTTIGLTGAMFTVGRKLHAESLTWKPIDFLDRKFVTLQVV